MEEIWKPVVGYEGLYDVSNMGRVRSYYLSTVSSLGRFVFKVMPCPQKTLAIKLTNCGYLVVGLYRNGAKSITFHVHRIVLDAFVGPRPKKYECCHKNNVKTDNRLDNICWGTSSSNKKDYGTQCRGEDQGSSRFTVQDIITIRNFSDTEYSKADIARLFNAPHQTISKIINRRTWKHI
jgi:hypothetical protein